MIVDLGYLRDLLDVGGYFFEKEYNAKNVTLITYSKMKK